MKVQPFQVAVNTSPQDGHAWPLVSLPGIHAPSNRLPQPGQSSGDLGAPGGPALESTIPLRSAAAAYAAFLDTNVVLTETQDGSIQIWNISDPRHPRQTASLGNVGPDVDSIDGMGPPNGIGSNENVLAVQGDGGVMHLWHISSTGTATQRGTFTDPASRNAPASVLGGGNTAFMTTKTGIDW